MRRDLRAVFRPGPIRDIFCARSVRAPPACLPQYRDKFSERVREGTRPMALPLHAIRVLDVTNVLAGPFCSFQLVLLGAEVIKIEHPGKGDLARQLGTDPETNVQLMGASFVSVNAGKQSVTLNLKSNEGKEIFNKLAAISHAVIENFRPGVMARLGLDYPVLAKVDPRLR